MEQHTIEECWQKLCDLESLVFGFIDNMNKAQEYTDADINGCRKEINDVSQTMSDVVYPEWNPNGYEYYQGERVSYDSKYYRCIQNHKSQADWMPTTAVSLWSEITEPSEEYPEWKQPQGAHDAYNKGDKVSHIEKHWVSDIDANVYEPSVFGWTEV